MLYQHNFNDANRPASKANPQGMVLNRKGEVLYAQKLNVVSPVNTSNSALAKATVGLMRKISNTQPIDQFHQATSLLHFFSNVSQMRQSDSFILLAENYTLNGPSISEMCDHNSNLALECGKPHIATVWKLVKIIYGEETMMRGYVQSGNNNRDDISLNIHPLSTAPPSPVPPSVEFKDEDYEQRSRVTTDGETPAAQFSGGDDETENEDQVDAMIYNNAFPTYLNYRSGLPKGDFTFGEIELDTEMDGLMSDYTNGFSYPDIDTQKMKEDEFILPHEGFPLRHEIRDHSPPVDHFPDRSSPVLKEEQPISFQPLDEEQDLKPGRVSVSHPLRKPVWDPGNIVVEALKHHAELGDIQTTASVLIVIGDCRKSLKLSDARQEYWLLGYIELLTQYKLFNVASQVIKLSWIPSVLQLSQMSTRINTNCSKCSKPLQRIGWLCDRCHSQKYSLCIVCHQVVKGLYAWCQGCSHGGHINHIKEWLAKRKTCPSGCGHSCLYNFGQNWQMNMRQPSTHLLK